jgi:hypothetical protein
MPGMKNLPVLLLCLYALIIQPAYAEWGESDFDLEPDKPWVEVAPQLPAYPKTENLIPFTVSSATSNRHFIDAASISVGEDQVIRYTVVIETTGGAKNIFFEGLRCGSGERRLYAYGHPDGTWSKVRNAGWEAIKFRSLLSYRKALYEEYFCPNGLGVRDSQEAIENLRREAR